MAEASIINIADFRARTATGGGIAEPQPIINSTPLVTETDISAGTPRLTNLEDLYAEDVASTALIRRARSLLHNIGECAKAAHEAYTSNDEIGADHQTMLLRADLLELFLCRNVSEGMAAFVLALHYALHNKHGVPLDLDQLYAVRKALQHLHSDMFMSFSESIDLIDSLAGCGLIVDPPEATILTNVFSDQNSNEGVG